MVFGHIEKKMLMFLSFILAPVVIPMTRTLTKQPCPMVWVYCSQVWDIQLGALAEQFFSFQLELHMVSAGCQLL